MDEKAKERAKLYYQQGKYSKYIEERKQKLQTFREGNLTEYQKEKIEKINDNMQYCSNCKKYLSKSLFTKSKQTITGTMCECKNCRKIKYFTSKQTLENRIIKHFEKITFTKYCKKCSEYKNTTEYSMKGNKLHTYCRNCKNSYNKTVSAKIHKTISARISVVLQKNKMRRRTFDLLGFTKVELMNHLEKQFDENMNWSNFGKYWQIDHKIPISYYKVNSFDDLNFKLCWRLDNLRPLSAVDNYRKKNKILPEFEYLLKEDESYKFRVNSSEKQVVENK